ncbi:putative metal-dependent hydrolase [Frankia sp. CpI1-P]|nr:metal-dependent hydrolase [Frankia sp. CpI1-P]KQM03251.1 putative metal-dependent hydrolase [Frankia sp. CpI1-P]
MRVRSPEFDFTDVSPRWGANLEAVHLVNAQGIIPAYIEPFLIKVMRRAAEELDPLVDAELLHDIDLFNRQEGQHYRLHRAFNAMVRDGGYPDMTDYEAVFERDYEHFLRTRSLRWLLAYCEGFETIGSTGAELWVDGLMETELGAPPSPAADLWKWHLAEEYEHRTVVNRVYHRLYGRPRLVAWLYRARGIVTASRHLNRRTSPLRRYLLDVDRRGMTDEQRRQSEEREAATARKLGTANLRRLARAFSPFYDPATTPPPAGQQAILARYPAAAAGRGRSTST